MELRILVVTQYFWPESFRVNDLVGELVQRGHAVTVLTGRPNYPDGEVFADYRANPDRYGEYSGARVIRVPMVSRGKGGLRLVLNYLSFAASATVVGAFRLRGEQFDVIFVYEPSPVTVGIPAIFLRWLKKAPVAFWVLDLWPETLAAIGVVRSRTVLALVGKLVAFIYARCDLVLAQSRSFMPQIGRYSIHQERIRYFPSWAETIFAARDEPPAPEISMVAGQFNVMFAGNIGDAQDFPAILDAAEALRDHSHIRWLVVGDGRMYGWVKTEIARRQLGDKVFLLGRFPVERMPSFYKHADALLVSLKPEPIFSMTIPGKVQSYLAAGIPIVAMLDGEGARVVKDGGAGITCAAGDGQGLAQAVLRLAGMSEHDRREMGARGAKLAATDFDRAMLIGRLEQWLEEMAGASVTNRAGLEVRQ